MQKILADAMAEKGFLTVAEFMALCLYHPKKGYYITKDPLGQQGDFTTAPEISQIFGELIGLWLADCWVKMGMPTPCTVVECGPGRGTLMADALRAMRQAIPAFYETTTVYMLETSPTLKTKQQKILAEHVGRGRLHWVENLSQVPNQHPMLVVGNEFLDAFPTRQFKKEAAGWQEMVVKPAAAEGAQSSQSSEKFPTPHALTFSQRPAAKSEKFPTEITEGFYEKSEALAWLQDLKNHLKTGYVLMIDYGYTTGHGNTLQAVESHQMCAPLAHPGQADLTTHVDFAAVQKTLGETACQLAPMGHFLAALGFATRTAKLAEHVQEAEQKPLLNAAHRLLHPQQMGELFKALCWRTAGLPAAEGFGAAQEAHGARGAPQPAPTPSAQNVAE